MLNLFTAVIIESFEKTQRTEEWAVQPSAVEDFVETWADFDDGLPPYNSLNLLGIFRLCCMHPSRMPLRIPGWSLGPQM